VRKLSEESTVMPRLRTDVTGMICIHSSLDSLAMVDAGDN